MLVYILKSKKTHQKSIPKTIFGVVLLSAEIVFLMTEGHCFLMIRECLQYIISKVKKKQQKSIPEILFGVVPVYAGIVFED
jgi:hypothetical protein